MRRFIIVTNKPDLNVDGKVIEMDINDISLIFNEDTLNVLTKDEYYKLLNSKYMIGIEVDCANYLKAYRKILKQILEHDEHIICIFDASIKRYINHHELAYFAHNKLLPSKLFNIEINSSYDGCNYKTIGLASIGLKEITFNSALPLNEEDFQIFKAVVTNFIIGKQASVYINNNKVDYILHNQTPIEFKYHRPNKIYDFYIRNDKYLDTIRYELINHNWHAFKQLANTNPNLGQFIINKAKINDIENFLVEHVEEFTIVCEEINYNQDNLFYAKKYL